MNYNINCINKRYLRLCVLTLEQEVNMIPYTVAFKHINANGGTKRFYRQVFVEEFDDNENNECYCIKLDDRILILDGLPILIDNYDLALIMASEFELQGEYMRLESMPISDKVISLIEKSHNKFPIDSKLRRQSYIDSVLNNLFTDLLRLAENERLKNSGFYDKYWLPIINWFNNTFNTNIKIDYMLIKGERDNINEFKDILDLQSVYDMNAEDVMEKYEQTEMAHKVSQLHTKSESLDVNYGSFKKFLHNLDDVRLWLLDDLIQWNYSPILSTALITNSTSLQHLFRAIQTPELDTSMIVPNEESLKINETLIRMASTRTFCNIWDKLKPINNNVCNSYNIPIIGELKHF